MAVNGTADSFTEQQDSSLNKYSGSCVLELKAEYPSTERCEKKKKRKRGDKAEKRKTLLFYGNYQQGEISQGVYLRNEEEKNASYQEDENTNSPLEEEYFDDELHFSNWKRGCNFSRSVSKRTKPKVKPHQKMRDVDNKKTTKIKQNVSENTCARKNNIQKKLDKLNLVRFGYGIYSRRCDPNEVANGTCSKTSLKQRKQPKAMVDHPNALKYELKSDNINKGTGAYMNKIAELQHRDITPEDFELLLMLDESVAPKTVSANFLKSLTIIVVEEARILGELCSICMEVYQASEKAKCLPCNHMFHVNCIDNWLSNASPNCPLDGIPVET